MKSSKPLRAFWQAGIDLILTPTCFSCGERLDRARDVLCRHCMEKAIPLDDNSCPRCHTLMEAGKCPECDSGEISYDFAHSAWIFQGPIKDVIHYFKYNAYSSLSAWLGEAMYRAYQEEDALHNCDVITPVPLYFTRKKERGYNQSELLARCLSKKSAIPYCRLLKRTRHTASQTLLSKAEREHNLDGAFALRGKQEVSGKRILLIDDVFTTGTTANQIAILLKKHGAREVNIFTAARAA
ncbi:MAG TPA: ComF family protein [Candidatus Cloacimonetes bacterium]|nr:ComF family protein [Candidatus Cloacimonadota bacterium]